MRRYATVVDMSLHAIRYTLLYIKQLVEPEQRIIKVTAGKEK